MLSSFSRITLSSRQIISSPLILPELLIENLSHEDYMRYFDEDEEIDRFKNDYFCKAVLKLSTNITATFESEFTYVS